MLNTGSNVKFWDFIKYFDIWKLLTPLISRVRPECPAGVKKRAVGRILSRVSTENTPSRQAEHKEHRVSLFLANTMSNAPKFDEVRSVILDWRPDLAFLSRKPGWDTHISDNLINIPGVDHWDGQKFFRLILGVNSWVISREIRQSLMWG